MKNEAMIESQTPKKEMGKKLFTRKVGTLFLCLCMMLTMAVAASADTTTANQTIVDSSAYQSLFDILTAQLNVANIVGVIGAILGVCVGLVFLWWGARKALAMLMSAFKKGKVSI